MEYQRLTDGELVKHVRAVMEHAKALKGHCNSYGTASCEDCLFSHIEECPVWYIAETDEEYDRLIDDKAVGKYFG